MAVYEVQEHFREVKPTLNRAWETHTEVLLGNVSFIPLARRNCCEILWRNMQTCVRKSAQTTTRRRQDRTGTRPSSGHTPSKGDMSRSAK